jgi:fructose-bisphosphate aldolase class II
MELWMTVATFQEILGDAGERQYAVGSFNVWDICSAKHLAAAAERSASPVIFSLWQTELDLSAEGVLWGACRQIAEAASVPIGPDERLPHLIYPVAIRWRGAYIVPYFKPASMLCLSLAAPGLAPSVGADLRPALARDRRSTTSIRARPLSGRRRRPRQYLCFSEYASREAR